MNCIVQLIVVLSAIFGAVSGQTCSNSNLLMTPILREQILNKLNEARQQLANGELFLTNGKYALQAANLPDLTWSCEMEEQLVEWMEEACEDYPSYITNPNISWAYGGIDDDDTLVQGMINSQPLLAGLYTFTSLSRHNLFLQPVFSYPYNSILGLSDKATKFACAIQHCNISGAVLPPGMPPHGDIIKNIQCRIELDQELEFGDEIYQISPSANYIPPTQDVICPEQKITLEQREIIKEKINQARAQISQGAYQLQNGNTALPPSQPLSPLLWNCEDENAMVVEKQTIPCPDGPSYNPATEYRKIQPGEWSDFSYAYENNLWSDFSTDFFVQNPNLNFLSSSVSYSTEYPAAFALSKDAQSVACYKYSSVYTCWNAPFTYHLICRVTPSLPMYQDLY